MKTMKRKISLIQTFLTLSLVLLTFSSLSAFSSDISSKKLTIEWLFDKDIQEKFGTPRHIWLENSSAILLDFRKEKNVRTLELLDPRNGKRTPAIDKDKVLSALRNICGTKAPSFIQWPDGVDPNGKAVVYIIAGDLFCIELLDSNVKQLTKTPSDEKSPAFSPDGNWVSFIRENDLYVIEWKTGIEKRLTTGASETLLNGPLSYVYQADSGRSYEFISVPYRWSPDSKAIVYLQSDDSPVSISTFVNFRPQTQEVVRQRYPKAGQTNPKVRLGIVELFSAKTTWIDCGEYEYLARFKWLPNSKEIAAQTLNRKQSEMKLMFADRESGKSREILVEKQPAWINLGPSSSLYFLKDGKQFIWLSERDGYQHAYVYRIDGSLIQQLTRGDFMISAGSLVSRSGGLIGVDEKAAWVYFISNKKALKERHLYRIKLDGTGLQLLSKGDGMHTIVFSPCMKYYFDTFSNSSTPPSLSLYQADGTRIAAIAPPAKSLIDEFNISYPEFHTFKADDGLELPAMMTKPLDFNPGKKYPAIVYIYGGPGSQTVDDNWGNRWLWHSLLAQEGFFVFVFEVKAGMGKSHSLETSVYKQAYGMQNVRDILAGVRWIKQMPYIDSERLGIWGWSGGGCTTLYTMTHSDAFKAGIAGAPVSDWNFYDSFYAERYQSTPQDNPEGYKETSSALAASNLKGHLLIIQGTYDDNVHPQNTFAFVNNLIEHNIKFEMMIYPWRKHGINDKPAQIHLYNLMLDFWNRNLK